MVSGKKKVVKSRNWGVKHFVLINRELYAVDYYVINKKILLQ